ncbi:MAG: Lrp/AsnC family transcriptional regulator [Rickettsiales bacterium]
MDEADRRILKALQSEPMLTMRELGEKTGISHTPCWRRLDKLKKAGVVEEKRYIIDPQAAGFGIKMICFVRLKEHSREQMQEFERAVVGVPEVLQCYTITGDYDCMLHVIAKDVADYESTVKNSLMRLPNVGSINTSLSLKEIKNTSKIPL